MTSDAALLLGMVTMVNPKNSTEKVVRVRGFDFLGFFFPFLRYAFAGQIGNAVIAFLISCTVIGYPICCWYAGFKFNEKNFEHYLKNGWVIKKEKPVSLAS